MSLSPIAMFTFLAVMLLFHHQARSEVWDGSSDPSVMDNQYEYRFSKLPLGGILDRKPWSETYWPDFKGNINYRWNSPGHEGFGYHSPSKRDLQSMSPQQLEQLAPSEKYDIFMARYDYPLRSEVDSTSANSDAKFWQGICDGWSISAIQYAEPKPVTVTNPDGILVPFGSSDIKGLMAYFAAVHFGVSTHQVGRQCNFWGCNSINAGALHVILSNELALKKMPFIIQRVHTHEIWNQPTYGFQSVVRGSAQPEAGDHGVLVHTTLYYTDELDEPLWKPVTGTSSFVEGKVEMDYILDLDSSDEIIGGEYTTSDYPGFVWVPVNHLEFTGAFDGINRLYQPVKK